MHGGDIYRNRTDMDFSVNINPLGMPAGVSEALSEAAKMCTCYPDYSSDRLKEALGSYLKVDVSKICLGNGASELFTAIVHAMQPGKVLLQAPSFVGYLKCIEALEHCEIQYFVSEKETGFALTDSFPDQMEGIDLIFLTNPNNPTGKAIDEGLLEKILTKAAGQGSCVVVDECFLEFLPDCESRSFVQRTSEFPGLIVVRAFTKICAVPGVRIGYCVCERDLTERLRKHLPEWNLSVFAQKAGEVCARALMETDYPVQTRKLVNAERHRLATALGKVGFTVFPSDADFLLIYTEKDIYRTLLAQGILIRDCSDFAGLEKGYYRLAVRNRNENDKLLECLRLFE